MRSRSGLSRLCSPAYNRTDEPGAARRRETCAASSVTAVFSPDGEVDGGSSSCSPCIEISCFCGRTTSAR